jgi:hypothetical protein
VATRYGRVAGRFFGTRDELRRLDRGLELYQQVHGTEVDWFFLEHPGHGTLLDDIYDEGFVESGKRFRGPRRIPVLSAVVTQGQEETGDQGFITFDRVVLRLSYEQARKAGLDLDLVANREERLHDRFVFRRRVFDVESVQTAGHFEPSNRDVTLHVVGRQLRFDELYDSPDFREYVVSSSEPGDSQEDARTPFWPSERMYPS